MQLYRFTISTSETATQVKVKEFEHCGEADNYAWQFKQCKIERIRATTGSWIFWKYSVPWSNSC